MKVKIKETGEIRELSVVDPRTGVDWIQDFVGNAGALIDGQFTAQDDGTYVASKGTFEWWEKAANEHQAMDERIEELSDLYGSDVITNIVSLVADVDLEDLPSVVNRELDEFEAESPTPQE